jgi:hypothetical protein
MRFKEIMEQLEFHKDHKDAIPGAVKSGLDANPEGPSNYYHKYRLGVAMAGSPEHLENITNTGPACDNMVTLSYTDADRDIIKKAHNKMGYPYKELTSQGSKEHESVNKASPVPKRRKNQHGV